MTAARRPDDFVRRLLIADDRARTRRALTAVLATRAGFELVGEAADGAEALAAVEQLQPDIVIIDVRMPRMDGIMATRHIKSRWPWIRVVAHSLAEELRTDALAAGADAFVPKGAPVPSSAGHRVRRQTMRTHSARAGDPRSTYRVSGGGQGMPPVSGRGWVSPAVESTVSAEEAELLLRYGGPTHRLPQLCVGYTHTTTELV